MTHRQRASGTGWLDLWNAADRAEVGYDELVEAITARQIRAVTTLPSRPGDWMVPASDVESWRRRRRVLVAPGG